MAKKYEFYPMINQTIKSFMLLAKDQNEKNYIYLILSKYPQDRVRELNDCVNINPLLLGVLNELDRQYSRWAKGGVNENI